MPKTNDKSQEVDLLNSFEASITEASRHLTEAMLLADELDFDVRRVLEYVERVSSENYDATQSWVMGCDEAGGGWQQ